MVRSEVSLKFKRIGRLLVCRTEEQPTCGALRRLTLLGPTPTSIVGTPTQQSHSINEATRAPGPKRLPFPPLPWPSSFTHTHASLAAHTPKTPAPTTAMAAGEHPLVKQSTVPVVSDAADASSNPYVRPALFLCPRAGDDAVRIIGLVPLCDP